MIFRLLVPALFIFVTACNDQKTSTSSTSSNTGDAEKVSTQVYAAAVQHPGRSDADRARDVNRKPAEVLEFFAIEPGMTVLDMFSGGGYYTEVLSRVVGDSGRVIAHSNEAYAQFVGEEATKRYANNRLANVEFLMAENDALELPDATFDAVMMVLAYHDIYYVSPNDGWPKIDGPHLLQEIYDALNPGGSLAIVDHYATAGSPRETGNTLHRIDPDIVIEEVTAAGFVLDAKSNVLRNMNDDHSLNMSAPEIRGKTDRFVFRFVKPE